jgi:hypothetical protein
MVSWIAILDSNSYASQQARDFPATTIFDFVEIASDAS